MKWTAIALASAVLGVASVATAAPDVLTLDLTNWGEGVYYLKGKTLGMETNGQAGLQDRPLPRGFVADALVLP